MNNVKSLALSLIGLLLAYPLTTYAEDDENFIFSAEKYSTSVLDQELYKTQMSLQLLVAAPSDWQKAHYPLITQARVAISLHYSGDNHRIIATANISNLDGFLKLSVAQRKQLVLKTLNLVRSIIGAFIFEDKQTGEVIQILLENRYIKLSFRFTDINYNDKNEYIRFLLPSDIGVASYRDGQFVFSETYYLNLKVHDGVAVSGDPNKFIIEHE